MKTNSPQRSWLSYLRHEICTPVNVIIGYSGLLLEELEELNLPEHQASIDELQKIEFGGNQLLAIIESHLSSAMLQQHQQPQEIGEVGKSLRAELYPTAQQIIGDCQFLAKIATPRLLPDLKKIDKAVHTLIAMLEELLEQAQQDIPLVEAVGISIIQETAKPSSSEAREKESQPGHILVVDDKETNRDLISRQLRDRGYNSTTVSSGKEALQVIGTGQFDLILLDVIMPDMNGYQVLKWLRESQWQHIPVIMISAFDEVDSAIKCIEMGAEDYLTKPFNPVLLRARIDACLEKKRLRDREVQYLAQLAQANQEITTLNQRLKAENLRLSAELEVTRQLQQMILPKDGELKEISGLEIAGYMQPADEVGGDYYDVLPRVLPQAALGVRIGIGDVTGHGLKSGVLMLMVQTAIRTLTEINETNPIKFFDILNRTIYNNIERTNLNRHLTLSILDYQDGILELCGQHEKVIVVRSSGELEQIDTVDLGFPIGLDLDIAEFVKVKKIPLNPGDIVVLYTDGLTEAENSHEIEYGLERLCQSVSSNRNLPPEEIKQSIVRDLENHLGEEKPFDDVTFLILKKT
ncbi:PP2C family protein-serine/threonine phosphatase [Lusitaniella coriacea]|uniref:PP2C family protein-serine/threonine phosphatase n=1 Tax=Lusitaniella coriacea TaxID=1983105 RepID=UPI003CE971FE